MKSSLTTLHLVLLSAAIAAAVGALSLIPSAAADDVDTPPELGRVEWLRNFEDASQRARESGRPLFVLFQEVPGCATCVSFGSQVLSHPLLVEAIESEFVPVAVFNNLGGEDAALLSRFGEPSWNNPVVRLLDADGRDLLPRRAGVWQPHQIGQRMVTALRAAGRPVPGYLTKAVAELTPRRPAVATLAMHCFWTGEACLGEIPGLLSSRAGFLADREVVEVMFDPDQLSYRDLLARVKQLGCADRVYTHSDTQQQVASRLFAGSAERTSAIARPAPASDQKHALRGSALSALDLTPQQALRANAAVAAGSSPAEVLSPRQLRSAGLSSASER